MKGLQHKMKRVHFIGGISFRKQRETSEFNVSDKT